MNGGEAGQWARLRRTQWDVVAVTTALLGGSAAFVAWRVATPAECAWLAPDKSQWTAAGVLPRVAEGCELPAGQLVTWAGRDGNAALLTVANGTIELATSGDLLGQRAAGAGWTLLFVVALFALCSYAFLRRPEDRAAGAAMVFAGGLLGTTATTMLGLPPSAAFTGLPRWLFIGIVGAGYTAVWGAGLLIMVVFPTPMLDAAGTFRNRAAIASAPLVVWLVVAGAAWAASRDFLEWAHHVILAESIITTFTLFVAGTVVVFRMWRLRTAPAGVVERQQLFWVGGSALAAGMLAFAFWMVPQVITGSSLLPPDLIGLPGLIFVAGLGIGMLRYRMFDLEVVLVRTIVYSALTLVAVATYLGVVGLLAHLAAARWAGAHAAVAAILVALLLQPLRERLERLVNRVLYRTPDDPYQTLSRVAATLASRDFDLARVAADVRRAMRVPYVAIAPTWGGTIAVGREPAPPELLLTIPLVHQRTTIGDLEVQTRGRGEKFSRAERRLLLDLSRQIAAALHHEELSAELQVSRERLVLAREEERRVIRRVLHDEVGPTVAGISLQVATARELMAQDSVAAADSVLTRIGGEAISVSTALRGLSYELRPPALDDRGLVPALRDHAAAMTPITEVTALGAAEPGHLPAAVEVAAYRIAMGAMTNVADHARAANCWVRLVFGAGELRLTVEDDGVGLPPDFRAGVGVISMRERARELGGECHLGSRDGGGTVVSVVIPTAVHR